VLRLHCITPTIRAWRDCFYDDRGGATQYALLYRLIPHQEKQITSFIIERSAHL
jgi:hypothetical protein